jgi:hypothetical protein
MKKLIFLLITAIFFHAGVKAQSDTIYLPIKAESRIKKNGTSLLHTVKGKFKLYVTSVNGKVTEYYGVDENGKRIETTAVLNGSKIGGPVSVPGSCFKCIQMPDGTYCKIITCPSIASSH